MGRYDDEFARADARERELQRQLQMQDGISTPNSTGGPAPNCAPGFDPNHYQGYGPNYNPYFNQGASPDYGPNYYPYNPYNAQNGFGNMPMYGDQSTSKRTGFLNYNNNIYNRKPVSMRSTKRAFGVLTIVFFCIGLILLGVMYLCLRSMRSQYDRCNADVQAVVEDIKVETRADDDGIGSHDVYFPVVRYEYDGKQYRNQYDVYDTVSKYREGQSFTIHVNPNDPNEFYIEKNDGEIIVALLILAGGFFALGIMFFIIFLRCGKKMHTQMQ